MNLQPLVFQSAGQLCGHIFDCSIAHWVYFIGHHKGKMEKSRGQKEGEEKYQIYSTHVSRFSGVLGGLSTNKTENSKTGLHSKIG